MTTIRKILVPVDFSPHSAAALDVAIELAKRFEAGIHLLHCYPVNPGAISPYGIVVPPNLDAEVRDAASRKLGEWIEKTRAQGVPVEEVLTSMFPSEAISRTAEEIDADMIVMGTRGLTGIKHVVLGSVAERTIRTAPCPVLTVKGPDEE